MFKRFKKIIKNMFSTKTIKINTTSPKKWNDLENIGKSIYMESELKMKPFNTWADIGDWNDFENIGKTIDIGF